MAEQTAGKPLLIIGTGALASLFAARLLAAGQQVLMLGSWPAALAALNSDGLTLEEGRGEAQTFPVQAISHPEECPPVEFALVLVKSWQTARAAEHLAACLPADGLALTLQNGLGNREILEEALGAERVALGATTTGATLLGPGRVRAGGPGVVTLAERSDIQPLADKLTQAGFEIQLSADVEALLWGKLVVNAAINPLTAMLEVPNGELLENPPFRNLMRALAEEVAVVAAARGIALKFDDPAAAAEEVARRTAANKSSMLQDVQRRAPTEIDAICGAVVRAGKESGVAAPLNEMMWNMVKTKVEQALEHEDG